MTSAEMPVLTLCAAGDKFYSLPDVDDIVVCLFAGNADQTGTGWIIGSRFNDKSKPNANSQDVTRLDFKDNTFVEYDRKSHKLKIKCEGDISIEATGEIVFKGQKNFTLTATQNINLTATQNIVGLGEKILLN